LVRELLRPPSVTAKRMQFATLFHPGPATGFLRACQPVVDESRLQRLLTRGFLLSQAVERWQTRAIWVISRADPEYPRRLKARLREDAPALFYGCGDVSLLETGGLAVVGSRHVDDSLIDYTMAVGRLAARAGRTIVSGGARGIDQAAMRGALEAGGKAVLPQPELSLFANDAPAEAEPALPVVPDAAPVMDEAPVPGPAEALFAAVRTTMQRLLKVPMREAEVADALAVSNAQSKEWLLRLVDEGVLEKLNKPVRYVVKRQASLIGNEALQAGP